MTGSVGTDDRTGSEGETPSLRTDPGIRDVPDAAAAVALKVLHAVATGTPTEDAVCTGLAHVVNAAVAAYVALDPGGRTAHVVAWPPSLEPTRVQGLLALLPVAVPHLLEQVAVDRRVRCTSTDGRFGRHDVAADMRAQHASHCANIAQVPLDVPGRGGRLVLLGRTRRFGVETVRLLDFLRGPLADVVRVAGERGGPVTRPVPAPHGLTGREIEVLQLMAEGLLAHTIAIRLDVSPRTIHKHLGNIYRKLDVHDRLVAVRRAEGLGLLEPTPPAAAVP